MFMLNGKDGAGAGATATATAVTVVGKTVVVADAVDAAIRSFTFNIEHWARFVVSLARRVALSMVILYLNSGAVAGAGTGFVFSVMH